MALPREVMNPFPLVTGAEGRARISKSSSLTSVHDLTGRHIAKKQIISRKYPIDFSFLSGMMKI